MTPNGKQQNYFLPPTSALHLYHNTTLADGYSLSLNDRVQNNGMYSNVWLKTIQIKSRHYIKYKKQLSQMSWRYKNRIVEDEDDEKYCNQDEQQGNQQQANQQGDDPLDAFMNDLEQAHPPQLGKKHENYNLEGQEKQDDEQDYSLDQNQRQEILEDLQSEEYEPKQQRNRKIIQPLKPFDFSTVHLENFDKNFYTEHVDITNMPNQVSNKLMKQHQIKITGKNPPKLIVSFGHLPLTDKMVKIITQQGFQHPTPIQAQALPCAFSGRDVVGIAKTGSGKTLAYVWPMIVHVLNRKPSQKGDGPVALILAPTRQLCQQIYVETKRYTKKEHMKIDCLLGGENKHEQWKSLKAGTDILIASPGRLIQFLRKKATNLIRVTYLVLDEADRMLSLGFEQQIRSIVAQTRDDRQTLLFTATMKKNMQVLVGDIVTDPLRIIVGDQQAANEDVKQEVVVVKQEQEKIHWLEERIEELVKQGKVLVFVNQKVDCQNIGTFLEGVTKSQVLVLHGDKNQYERTTIMNSFKADSPILVATEVAARGIDVKNIKTVVNYQCPKTIEAYIHRIGRAGRAGEVGTSYTFLLPTDVKFAISLVGIFENSGYPVPDELEQLAMLDDGYRRKRITAKMGVTFAKGNDATKYLNHALKRQRKGYSRAGLGYDDTKKKGEQPSSAILNLNEAAEKMKSASIQDLSKMIRQRMSDTKIENKYGKNFIKSEKDELSNKISEPTVVYFKKKQA